MTTTLIKVEISRDVNEYGQLAYLVTPIYNRDGLVMSVPDTKGWPTLELAKEEAAMIRNKHLGMSFANAVSAKTAAYDPAIERHENGDITFHWPIKNERRAYRQRETLAGLIGIEEDMLDVRPMLRRITLHVPAGIADNRPQNSPKIS